MKTNAASTSIDNYHAQVVGSIAPNQQARILAVMQAGRDYSMCELGRLTGIDKSSISARLNQMCKDGTLEHGQRRECSISRVSIRPVRKVTA